MARAWIRGCGIYYLWEASTLLVGLVIGQISGLEDVTYGVSIVGIWRIRVMLNERYSERERAAMIRNALLVVEVKRVHQ